jgi:hypothetical protein
MPSNLPQAYDRGAALSTHRAPWRAALIALNLTLLVGTAVWLLAAAGAFDPPRAGLLVGDFGSPEELPLHQADEGFHYYGLAEAPMGRVTLDVQADFTDSAGQWGFWLNAVIDEAAVKTTLLIRPDGYLSISPSDQPDWRPFMHLRHDTNHLTLDIDSTLRATLRINSEIAWSAQLESWVGAGLVVSSVDQLTWEHIRLYSGD